MSPNGMAVRYRATVMRGIGGCNRVLKMYDFRAVCLADEALRSEDKRYSKQQRQSCHSNPVSVYVCQPPNTFVTVFLRRFQSNLTRTGCRAVKSFSNLSHSGPIERLPRAISNTTQN